MNQEKQPSYYAIIPATVRYDERLKFAERLLYGEITSLIGKEGRYILMPGIKLREQGRVKNFAYPIKDEARLQILKAISEKYDEECANSEIIEDED